MSPSSFPSNELSDYDQLLPRISRQMDRAVSDMVRSLRRSDGVIGFEWMEEDARKRLLAWVNLNSSFIVNVPFVYVHGGKSHFGKIVVNSRKASLCFTFFFVVYTVTMWTAGSLSAVSLATGTPGQQCSDLALHTATSLGHRYAPALQALSQARFAIAAGTVKY
ncbi:hypothetical protein EDB83DRAFT_2319417 [Lactarius deliciosus]|nr:hypothetical protein EDB83DRAFT_2319417 [Lactarius deliciosus]